jgi:hypothetical protein
MRRERRHQFAVHIPGAGKQTTPEVRRRDGDEQQGVDIQPMERASASPTPTTGASRPRAALASAWPG